jgi:hypothetical protein
MSGGSKRNELLITEVRSRPIRDKHVDVIQDIILPKTFDVTAMSVDHHQEVDCLPHSSVRKVYGKLVYPKHDLTINWKFLLLLTITLLGFVSAASDCEIMEKWLPDMFSATGTDCCYQTGITCVSDRITVMYDSLKLTILEICVPLA